MREIPQTLGERSVEHSKKLSAAKRAIGLWWKWNGTRWVANKAKGVKTNGRDMLVVSQSVSGFCWEKQPLQWLLIHGFASFVGEQQPSFSLDCVLPVWMCVWLCLHQCSLAVHRNLSCCLRCRGALIFLRLLRVCSAMWPKRDEMLDGPSLRIVWSGLSSAAPLMSYACTVAHGHTFCFMCGCVLLRTSHLLDSRDTSNTPLVTSGS